MISQELTQYVTSETLKGRTKEEIIKNLINGGWNESDAHEVYNTVFPPSSIPTPTMPLDAQIPVPSVPLPQDRVFPSAFTILGQAWLIYKERFWVFVGINVFPALVNVILQFLLKTLSSSLGANSILIIISKIIIYLIIFSISVWAMSALMYAIKDHREKIGIIESYRRGLAKSPYLFGTFLLYILIVVGGMSLFFIPGIIFSIYFIFTVFIVISEDIIGMDALLKSREYTRGYWGKIFWRILLIGLPFLVAMPIILISGIFLPVLVVSVISILFSLIVPPLMQAYLFSMYEDIKVIKSNIVFTPKKSSKVIVIVIAIVGILIPLVASILLSALSTARDKGNLIKQEKLEANLKTMSVDTLLQNTSPSNMLLEEKSYVDNKAKFKINIPKGWVFDEYDEGKYVSFSETNQLNENINARGAKIEVRVSKISADTDLDTYISGVNKVVSFMLPGYKLLEINKIISNGEEARIVNSTFSQDEASAKMVQLFVIKNHNMYFVTSTIAPISAWDTYSDVVNASLMSLVLY